MRPRFTEARPSLFSGEREKDFLSELALAEMARRDLDAALQLLADRAQYITGASGAAIALRRNGKNDMLCRASAGSSAPELGALLSTEFGLSGESVRTRRALRCDDAERDQRVNREVCRRLGIASVVVMPVVNDDEVLGVFELFSGKANAFGERDVSAVRRLSELVETAVKLSDAVQSLPQQLGMQEISELEVAAPEAAPGRTVGAPAKEVEAFDDLILEGEVFGAEVLEDVVLPAQEPVLKAAANTAAPDPAKEASKQTAAPAALPLDVAAAAPAEKTTPATKPVFWSVQNVSAEAAKPAEADQSQVPPGLRSLHKCVACGFPVSTGRVLCVECEEKKWRGQLRASRAAAAGAVGSSAPIANPSPKPAVRMFAAPQAAAAAPIPAAEKASTSAAVLAPPPTPEIEAPSRENDSKPEKGKPIPAAAPDRSIVEVTPQEMPQVSEATSATLVLSAGLEPSQSWLSANKYIIGVLLAIAGGAAAVFFLR